MISDFIVILTFVLVFGTVCSLGAAVYLALDLHRLSTLLSKRERAAR